MVSLPWTPSTEGQMFLQAVVVLEGDENMANDTTETLAVEVLPETMHAITIGNGTALVRAPMDMSNKQSLSQVLYFPEEIGTNGGEIKGLVYQSKFSDTCSAPVRIWIGETTRSSLCDPNTLEFHWMNPDSLTEVFNGEVSIKNVDKSDVLFEFDEPYPYHGGNLVVYVYMDDTKFHGRMTQFYGTSEPGVYHTLMKYTSTADLDPEAPAGTGDLTYYFESRSNTTFLMDMSGTGSLQGKVTDAAGSPLAGAFLRVAGSQLSDSADREGRYSFDYLAAGETSLEVEKFGYRNRTGSVEVKAMQENTLDLVMEAYDSTP